MVLPNWINYFLSFFSPPDAPISRDALRYWLQREHILSLNRFSDPKRR